MDKGAHFSEDRNYRYSLWRIWDRQLPFIQFIGLNPSTADEATDDPTIRRVIRLAKDWGYGGVYMTNCYAYISTDPKLLKRNPMSDEWNNNTLVVTAAQCKAVVFAWGNFQIVSDTGRNVELMEMFPHALCLGKNKNGSPKHPLYIKANTRPVNFLP